MWHGRAGWTWEGVLTVIVCSTFLPVSPRHTCLGGRVHCTTSLPAPGVGGVWMCRSN